MTVLRIASALAAICSCIAINGSAAVAQPYPAYPSGPSAYPREAQPSQPYRVTPVPDYDDEEPTYDPRDTRRPPAAGPYADRPVDPSYRVDQRDPYPRGEPYPREDNRVYGARPYDQRPYDQRPYDQRPYEPRPGGQASEPRPGGQPYDPRYGAGAPPNDPRYGAPAPRVEEAVRPASPGIDQREMRPPGDVGPQTGPAVASLPPDDQPETGEPRQMEPRFQRQLVDYTTKEPAGTLIIDTPNTYLYLVLGKGKAMRYGIGVGREGFTWAGAERISRMAEWPDWHPPEEMIERQPYLPRFMAGGPGNPLGARALYLGKTLFRIHGTNQPSTIGTFVSSGCIRLLNSDIEDLYQRVNVGTRVVVLPGKAPQSAPQAAAATR